MWQQIGSHAVFRTRAIGKFCRKYFQNFVRNYVLPVSILLRPRSFIKSSLYGMEVRSAKSGNQRHISTIRKDVAICFSPIQPNTSSIVKAKVRKNLSDIGGISMVVTSMVFISSEHIYPQSTFIVTSGKDLLLDTSWKTHPLVLNQTLRLTAKNHCHQKELKAKLQIFVRFQK